MKPKRLSQSPKLISPSCLKQSSRPRRPRQFRSRTHPPRVFSIRERPGSVSSSPFWRSSSGDKRDQRDQVLSNHSESLPDSPIKQPSSPLSSPSCDSPLSSPASSPTPLSLLTSPLPPSPSPSPPPSPSNPSTTPPSSPPFDSLSPSSSPLWMSPSSLLTSLQTPQPVSSIPMILDELSNDSCIIENKFDNLSQELVEFCTRNQLTLAESNQRRSIIKHVGSHIHRLLGAEVRDFGSFSQGLATKDSDLDLALFLPPSSYHPLSVLDYLAYYLQALGQIEKLFHTRVPILKLSLNAVSCDISLCSPDLHVGKAKLLKLYTELSPHLVPLILFIKNWAKRRYLASANIGMLHTFGWALLVINFLQRRTPPGLPIIEISRLNKLEHFIWENKNTETLGQLAIAFFSFHSNLENWNNCFSVRTGSLEKTDHFLSSQKNLIRIEDPLEIEQNIGRNIYLEKLKKIVEECERAKNLLLEYEIKNQDITEVLTTVCQIPSEIPPFSRQFQEKKKQLNNLMSNERYIQYRVPYVDPQHQQYQHHPHQHQQQKSYSSFHQLINSNVEKT